jgi:hypothetical protein
MVTSIPSGFVRRLMIVESFTVGVDNDEGAL